MCVRVYIYIHIYIYTNTHIYKYVYICIYTYVYMSIFIYVCKACFLEDDTPHGEINANRIPEWWGDFSQLVTIEKNFSVSHGTKSN